MKKRIILILLIVIILVGTFFVVRKIAMKNTQETSHNLIYTISFGGIKCITPTLYLYDDNTYEYYDTYYTNSEVDAPRTGIYEYDMDKIISNIGENNDFDLPYYITDSNNIKYTTSINNTYLKEFLAEINIKLDKCATIR